MLLLLLMLLLLFLPYTVCLSGSPSWKNLYLTNLDNNTNKNDLFKNIFSNTTVFKQEVRKRFDFKIQIVKCNY